MSITAELDALDPLGLAAVICDASKRLASKALWSVPSTQTLPLVRQLTAARAALDAARLHAIREVDTRGTALETGATSTSAWLNVVGLQRPGAAKTDLRVANQLAESYPATAEALAAGGVTLHHVQVICRVLHSLPDTVDEATLAAAELHLLKLAGRYDPSTLAKLGKRLKYVLDPDGERELAAEEARLNAQQELHLTQRDDGPWDLRATLDPETGAGLFAVLDVLSKPQPSSEDGPDPRSAARRRADALGELVELAAGADQMPTTNGAKPTIIVTIPYATLIGELGGPAATTMPNGHPMSASTVRRLCCDGKILPIVLGGKSQPLDVGRSSYVVPFHIRMAVLIRDNFHCAHPNCGAIARHIHHIIHWAHHGETVLHNLVALCGYHHRLVHRTYASQSDGAQPGKHPPGAFTITGTPGARPTFNLHPDTNQPDTTQQLQC